MRPRHQNRHACRALDRIQRRFVETEDVVGAGLCGALQFLDIAAIDTHFKPSFDQCRDHLLQMRK